MSRADLAKQFEDVFMRLLDGESDAPYAKTLSDVFEVMANTLFPHRGGGFDGVSPLWTKRRSPRKLEFIGDMHVLGHHKFSMFAMTPCRGLSLSR